MPGNRYRAGKRAWLDQIDQRPEPTWARAQPVQRAGLLPLAIYDDGRADFAVPGLLHEIGQAMNRQAMTNKPWMEMTPAERAGYIKDAWNISTLALGGPGGPMGALAKGAGGAVKAVGGNAMLSAMFPPPLVPALPSHTTVDLRRNEQKIGRLRRRRAIDDRYGGLLHGLSQDGSSQQRPRS